MKERLQRYMERAQERGHGAVRYTLVLFVEHSVVQEGEEEVAKEAIKQLVEDGILEYWDGGYYLMGNVPGR